METWQKIASGAAFGVVGMVAAPVLAPIGAITAVGTLIGAAVGGVVAYMASEDNEQVAEARGRSRAKAEYDVQLQAFMATCQRTTAQYQAQSHHMDVILALIGVGMASAGARDGDSMMAMSVKDFACGQTLAFLPPEVRHRIDSLVASPPTVKSAYQRACKVAPGDLALFDEMVHLVVSTDAATTTPSMIWRQLRAA